MNYFFYFENNNLEIFLNAAIGYKFYEENNFTADAKLVVLSLSFLLSSLMLWSHRTLTGPSCYASRTSTSYIDRRTSVLKLRAKIIILRAKNEKFKFITTMICTLRSLKIFVLVKKT